MRPGPLWTARGLPPPRAGGAAHPAPTPDLVTPALAAAAACGRTAFRGRGRMRVGTSGLGGPAGRTRQPRLLITLQAARERAACPLHTWAPGPAAAVTAGDSRLQVGHRLRLSVGGSPAQGYSPSSPAVQPPLSEEKDLERHSTVAVVRNPTAMRPRSPLSGPSGCLVPGGDRRPRRGLLCFPPSSSLQFRSRGKADSSAGGPSSGPGSAVGDPPAGDGAPLWPSGPRRLTARVTGLGFCANPARLASEAPSHASCAPAEADGASEWSGPPPSSGPDPASPLRPICRPVTPSQGPLVPGHSLRQSALRCECTCGSCRLTSWDSGAVQTGRGRGRALRGRGQPALKPWGVPLPPSAEAGLSGARRGQPSLPTGPGGSEVKATHLQCPSVTPGRERGWGPCPPQQTLQRCRREHPTCCGGGSFRVGNLTPPSCPSCSCPLRPRPVTALLVPSFCQSPISNAERRFFRTGHGGARVPAGRPPRGPRPAAVCVLGATCALGGWARVPSRPSPRVVGARFPSEALVHDQVVTPLVPHPLRL